MLRLGVSACHFFSVNHRDTLSMVIDDFNRE